MADAGSFVCADPLIYNRETIMREPTVRLSVEWPIATLTLNRPESLNAISLELIADFNAALDEMSAASPPSRCVVLTGAGRAFCVGGDITAHRDRPPDTPPYDLGDVLERYFNPLLQLAQIKPMRIFSVAFPTNAEAIWIAPLKMIAT